MPPEPSPDVDPEAKAAEREKPAPTPFDNPWLLPTLLIGFALWGARRDFAIGRVFRP